MKAQKALQKRRPVCAFTIVELLISVVLLAVLAALLFSGLGRTREVSRRVACQATLRSLQASLYAYATDYNRCLPAALSGGVAWPSRIGAYLSRPITKTEGDTYCPSTSTGNVNFLFKRDRATWRTDYTVNGNLMSNIESQNRLWINRGRLVLLYDGGGGARFSAGDAQATARHLERFNTIFVDGHMEVLENFDQHTDCWKAQ